MLRKWTVLMVAGLLLSGSVTAPVSANETQPPVQNAPAVPPGQVSEPGQQTQAAPETSAPTGGAPAPTVVTGVFADLAPDHWAYQAILQLHQAGVVSGDASGRFRAEDPVTRAEVVKMILGARQLDAGTECAAMFRDVACDQWFAPYVETAYRMAIVEGTGEDAFTPEGYVRRQDLITMLVRAMGRRWDAHNLGWQAINSELKVYSDVNKIEYWARPAVAYAVKNRLASGYQDGAFRPDALASRAEAAALVSRILVADDGLATAKVDGRTILYKQAFDAMKATMYSVGEPGVGHTTYTGLRVRLGAIAVDPKVIPLGSLLYVEGYGYGVAADIGGAVKGNHVDLFTWDYDQAARRFGVQQRRVWVLP